MDGRRAFASSTLQSKITTADSITVLAHGPLQFATIFRATHVNGTQTITTPDAAGRRCVTRAPIVTTSR